MLKLERSRGQGSIASSIWARSCAQMVSQGSELESCKIQSIKTCLVGFLEISVLDTMDRTYVTVLLEGSDSGCCLSVFVVSISKKKKKYLSPLDSSASFYMSLQEERVVMVLEYEQELGL